MRQWLRALGLAAFVHGGCAGTEGTLLLLESAGNAGSSGAAAGSGGGGEPTTPYVPPSNVIWQAKLTGPIEVEEDVELFYLDADLQAPGTLERLRAEGRRYLCYLSAGTMEDFRDDAADLPDSTVGRALVEFPNERWLDVRAPEVRSLMAGRIARLASLGCHGIPPSSLAVHAAETGFDLSLSDALDYARFVAERIHSARMSAGFAGPAELAAELWPTFDFGLAIACLEGTRCTEFSPFTSQGKPVLYIEYGDLTDAEQICKYSETLGFVPLITARSFNGQSVRCQDIL